MAAQTGKTTAKERAAKVASLLAMARRAGAIEPGLDAALRACRRGAAQMLVVTSDIGKSARSKASYMADDCGVDFVEIATTKEELGVALGLRDVAVVAVCNANFAKGVYKKI